MREVNNKTDNNENNKEDNANTMNDDNILQNGVNVNAKTKVLHGFLVLTEGNGSSGKIQVKCPCCNTTLERNKKTVRNRGASCDNCGYRTTSLRKLEGFKVNGYTVLSYEYRGRENNEPYYFVAKDGVVLPIPMTPNQMLELKNQ